MKLHDEGLPGPVADSLFTQCIRCGWTTTTESFHKHACLLPVSSFSGFEAEDSEDEGSVASGESVDC